MTLLFVFVALVTASFLIGALPMVSNIEAVIPLLMLIAWRLGITFDAADRGRRYAAALASNGFEPCDAALCDPVVEAAAVSMAPEPLGPDDRVFVVVGEIRGRTVYLAHHSVNGVRPYAFAAVQTARHWPETIVRRKRITGNLRGGHDLGDRAFNRQREILSDAPAEILRPFERLSGWFVTDDTVRKSFRMHEIPGKNEQWAFGGHWVALADRGHARPKQLLQLADFLVAFAEAADALDDPAAPGPDETEPD